MDFSVFRIFEELPLHALRDDTRTIRSGTRPDFAVAGGMLLELALANSIDVKPTQRTDRVIPTEGAKPDHPLLKIVSDKMVGAKRHTSARSGQGGTGRDCSYDVGRLGYGIRGTFGVNVEKGGCF